MDQKLKKKCILQHDTKDQLSLKCNDRKIYSLLIYVALKFNKSD